jgi:hypothetical protein
LGSNYDDGPQCFSSKYAWAYGITFTKDSNLTEAEKNRMVRTASLWGNALSPYLNTNPQAAFRQAQGKIAIDVGPGKGQGADGNCATTYGSGGSTIACDHAMGINVQELPV